MTPIYQYRSTDENEWFDTDELEFNRTSKVNGYETRMVWASPKAEWDAVGNPLNLMAAAQDVCSMVENLDGMMTASDYEQVETLRKFIGDES